MKQVYMASLMAAALLLPGLLGAKIPLTVKNTTSEPIAVYMQLGGHCRDMALPHPYLRIRPNEEREVDIEWYYSRCPSMELSFSPADRDSLLAASDILLPAGQKGFIIILTRKDLPHRRHPCLTHQLSPNLITL